MVIFIFFTVEIDIDGEKLVSPSYLHGIKDSFHTEHQDISPGIQQQNMFLDMQAQVKMLFTITAYIIS